MKKRPFQQWLVCLLIFSLPAFTLPLADTLIWLRSDTWWERPGCHHHSDNETAEFFAARCSKGSQFPLTYISLKLSLSLWELHIQSYRLIHANSGAVPCLDFYKEKKENTVIKKNLFHNLISISLISEGLFRTCMAGLIGILPGCSCQIK